MNIESVSAENRKFAPVFYYYLLYMYHFSSPTGCNILTFRHFGRKGYSLFAAIGKEVKVGVLSVATLATASSALAAGSGKAMMTEERDSLLNTTPDITLDEATASASRAPMTAAVAARVVMTFSRDDIAAAGVTSINDLIKLCAGVDVRQRGPHGVQTDISINGGTFDQITILLNGVNLSSPHTGHLSADFPITAQDIERIEVLEGAAARVYGTSAFTGAINIVTRKEQREVALHCYGGMYGYGGAEARISIPYHQWHNHVSGGYTRTDGATEHSGFQNGRVFWQGQYYAPNLQFDYQAGYSNKPYDANTFYGTASTDQWEKNERWTGALKLKTTVGRLNIVPQMSWNRWYDHYQWHKGSPAGENFHQVDVYALSLNNWVDWRGGKTSFGIEMRNEGIRSTKLGEALEESQWKQAHDANGGTMYRFAANRTNVSAHLEHNVILPHWTFSAGLLANMNTALDTHWRWYPGIDVAYRPNHHWSIFASWNMALRMPTFTDLYYSGTGIEGTRNLRPERTNDFSIKTAYSTRGLTADASVFYSHKTDMIDWVVLAENPTADPTDLTLSPQDPKNWVYRSGNYSLDNVGLRMNAAWLPRQIWGDRFPIRKVGVQYCFINEEISYPVEILASKYAMEYVRNKIVASADARLFKIAHNSSEPRTKSNSWRTGELTIGLSYRFCDRVESENYGLLDARLAWEAPHFSIYLDARNVLDKTYYDYSYIPQPGFWMVGGIKLTF